MIALVAFTALLAVASAQYPYSHNTGAYQPQHHQGGNTGSAPVHYVNIGAQLQGDYKFGYNTGNGGSFREETRNPDGSVSGAYGYIDANGQQKVIRYTAGKDGFKAEGDDVPKAPPAPQPVAPQPHAPAYTPQQSYVPPPAPTYNHNYVQHPPAHQYNYGNPHQGSYNPHAYAGHPNPAAPNHGSPLTQLSYNIGSGAPNSYQG